MQQLPKVLITDHVAPLLIEGLLDAGYDCDYQPKIDQEKVLSQIADFEGLIINSKIQVDKNLLDQAAKLQFVARLGSGLEIIDLDYAEKKGVLVHRSPDGNCDAVAEHAMGMLLSLANHLNRIDAEVRAKHWNREAARGWEIMGKTVGIMGFGYTGAAFAQRLSSFGCQIFVYDKYKKGFAQHLDGVQEVGMEAIFEQADILSLHLPLTEETIGICTTSFFEAFQKPIVLLNTSRGAVLPIQNLIQALNKGQVVAAGLDVFENEKPAHYTELQTKYYQDLFERPNVLLSPHVAGWTKESKERLAELLLKRILTKASRL